MRTNTTYATRSQLLDYVTKREFADFWEEFTEFKADTAGHFEAINLRFNAVDQRFDAVDKRFILLDRRINQLVDDTRLQIGTLFEQFREDLKTGLEYVQNVDAKKVDKDEFIALEIKVERILQK